MKKSVKINFADFWPHFDRHNNYFTQLLSAAYTVEISDNPDFLIYSCYGEEHLRYSCYRIYYNGENQRINWNACDYAFSFDYLDDERHFRLPNWIWYADPKLLLRAKPAPEDILREKTGFCNLVVSNPLASKRIEFFHKLSTYKKVDSGGRHLNNVGGPVTDKLSFVRNYKFTISFENSSYPGYTTEKIFEPMLVNSIPVYWGNPLVGKDFNTASFVNWHAFGNDEAVIDYIIDLDKNDDRYLAMQAGTWYNDNVLPDCVNEENILKQFDKIIASKGKAKPVAQTSKRFLYNALLQLHKVDDLLNRQFKYRKNFR